MKKKILAAACLLLGFALAACSSGSDDGNEIGDQNQSTLEFEDRADPKLAIESHQDGDTVTSGSRKIRLEGTASDDIALNRLAVSVNGELVEDVLLSDIEGASSDAVNLTEEFSLEFQERVRFSIEVTLQNDDNQIILRLSDVAENSSFAQLNLNFPFVQFNTFQSASVVLGQPDFASNSVEGCLSITDKTFCGPKGTHISDDGKLFIADKNNHRILIYNQIPTTNDAPANFVLGQWDSQGNPDFTARVSGLSKNRFTFPVDVQTYDGKLFVLDPGTPNSSGNHRLLIWNTIPTTPDQEADVVVGQMKFDESQIDCNAKTLFHPSAFIVADGKLIVADQLHHRVLIWNEIPEINGAEADIVIGQSHMEHCVGNDRNQDGTSTDQFPNGKVMIKPNDVWSDGKRVIVADGDDNRRILIWNQFPERNFARADTVLLQDTEYKRETINAYPTSIASNGNQLFAAIPSFSRILIWDSLDLGNNAKANRVIGQGKIYDYHEWYCEMWCDWWEEFERTGVQPPAPEPPPAIGVAQNDDNQDGDEDANSTARTLSLASRVHLRGDTLVVTDNGNNRILIYKAVLP